MRITLIFDNFPQSSTFCEIFTARKRSLGQGNIFTPVCHSVHQGVCSEGGGGAWSWGGLLGGRGVLVPRGGLLGGVPGPGGSALGVCAWWRPRWDGYCCRQYASYWNAFLSLLNFVLSMPIVKDYEKLSKIRHTLFANC